MFLHVLIAMVAGWLPRHQPQIITYLREENRVLKAQLRGSRLRLTDTERRRLATLAHSLGRTRLQDVVTIASPDTLLRWYTRLIAQKFDGSMPRRQCGRPHVAEEVEQLIVRIADPTIGTRNFGMASTGRCVPAALNQPSCRHGVRISTPMANDSCARSQRKRSIR
jgi:hypothetical protein